MYRWCRTQASRLLYLSSVIWLFNFFFLREKNKIPGCLPADVSGLTARGSEDRRPGTSYAEVVVVVFVAYLVGATRW